MAWSPTRTAGKPTTSWCSPERPSSSRPARRPLIEAHNPPPPRLTFDEVADQVIARYDTDGSNIVTAADGAEAHALLALEEQPVFVACLPQFRNLFGERDRLS